MGNLEILPRELLDIVLANLSTSELAALLRTCHGLSEIVEPTLYKRISWETTRLEDPAPTVYLLLRSILIRNVLAKHIHHLYLRGWHRNRTPRALIMQAYNTNEFKMLRETPVRMRTWSGRDAPWSQGLQFGKTDFFLAVVVSYCESLRSINLDFHYDASKSLVGLVLLHEYLLDDDDDSGEHGSFSFAKLRSIEFTGENVMAEEMDPYDEVTMDINHLVPALEISSVESIKASCVSRTAFEWPAARIYREYSTVVSLVIEKARCNERSLERLLSKCSCLRALVWDRMCDRQYDDSRELDCNVLYEGLRHVKRTIEFLRISVTFYATREVPFGMGQIRGRMGSLQYFAKLTHLDAPFAVILGWNRAGAPASLQEIMPRNLISLTVTDQTYRMAGNQLDFRFHLKRLLEYLVEARTGGGASVTTAGPAFDHRVNPGLELEPEYGVTRLAWGMTVRPAKSMASKDTATFYPNKSQTRWVLTTLPNTDGLQELHLHVCYHEWVHFAKYLGIEQICNSNGVSFKLMQPESMRNVYSVTLNLQ